MMNILKWLRKHAYPDCRHEWEQLELVSIYILIIQGLKKFCTDANVRNVDGLR